MRNVISVPIRGEKWTKVMNTMFANVANRIQNCRNISQWMKVEAFFCAIYAGALKIG